MGEDTVKYIKLRCNSYDCRTEFLIALDNWYQKEFNGEVHDYYSCPICEDMVYSEGDCIVEL